MIKFLYKYMLLRPEFFEEPMLRATPVSALNDPFEGLFYKKQIINANRHHENFYNEAGINEEQEFQDSETIDNLMGATDFDDLGIISFTEDHINPLMWAHYADEHKGIVVQFKTGISLFSDSSIHVEGIGFTRFGKDYLGEVFEFPERVVYRREIPTFEHKEEAEPESLEEYHWKKFNKTILFTKANDWLYEKESRSVVKLQDADRIICQDSQKIRDICSAHPEIDLKQIADGKIQITYPNGYEMEEDMGDESIKFEIWITSNGDKTPPIHLFRINPECIRGVYFGCKADYSSCLESIFNNKNLSHLSLNKMEIQNEAYSLFSEKIKCLNC